MKVTWVNRAILASGQTQHWACPVLFPRIKPHLKRISVIKWEFSSLKLIWQAEIIHRQGNRRYRYGSPCALLCLCI